MGLAARTRRIAGGRGAGQTGEFDFDTVYAFFSWDSMDESEGTLGIRIFHDGEVVMEGETTARAGNVSVDRPPNK